VSGFLKAIGRLVILGIPLDLKPLYGDAKPVSLPSAPLPTRSFWIIDDKGALKISKPRRKHRRTERMPLPQRQFNFPALRVGV